MLRNARRIRDDRGFTLIELLVVVVIIGILISIAIPLYLNYRKGANDKSAASDLRNAVTTLEQCNTDNNGVYPSAVSTAGVMTGCSTQSIKLSSGTTVSAYFLKSDGSAYIITTTNSNGASKTYCYNSGVGGSITTTTTAVTAWHAAC